MSRLRIGQKLKKVLGIVAPSIAKSIGGPLGGIAERFVQQALGVDSEESALAMIEQDPEALVKLRTAEMEYEKHLADNGVELERIAAGDRDSARQREIATGDTTQRNLAYLLTIGFFGTLLYILRYGVPAEGGEALLVLLGSLGTAWTGMIVYYYGSSVGSKLKTGLMARNGHG